MTSSPDPLRSLLSSLGGPLSSGVIARVWRARATPGNFPAYLAHVTQQVFPALQAMAGYRGGCVLQGKEADTATPGGHLLVEIQVITFWDSLEAIRSFAGEDCSRAVVEPAARAVLAGFDETARHFALQAVNDGGVRGQGAE